MMMKKTLVALALAATTVSGSAMAWTANGTGGSVELGGTLTPQAKVTPWEVMVGAAVSNLDAQIQTGTKVVNIPVTQSITALGIRTVSNQPFPGQAAGISPQIDFKGAIDTTQFTDGVTTLTLDVKDAADAKIGVMTAPLTAAGILSVIATGAITTQYSLYDSLSSGAGFSGGLASSPANVIRSSSTVKSTLTAINPEIMANYNTQGLPESNTPAWILFDAATTAYSAAYGAGILTGKNITLTLDTPAASNAIVWKASLPITVSYQ